MGKKVITIARQYGSKGREIAQKLADRLGIHYYDKELIDLVSQRSDLPYELLLEADEKRANSWQTPIADDIQLERRLRSEPMSDVVYEQQAAIIKELAEKEDCIIVGRCSNYVLKDFSNSKSVFVYAPMEKRVETIAERSSIDPKTARALIKKMDKQRTDYYNYYTDRSWNDMTEYSMCIDSSQHTIEQILDILENYYHTI